MLLMLLSFSLHAWPAQDNESGVMLNAQTSKVALDRYVSVFEDTGHELTIEQVASREFSSKFSSLEQPGANFGYTHSVWWLRFELESEIHHTWYLVNGAPGNQIELFVLPENPTLETDTNQFTRLSHRIAAWSLNLPPGERFHVYLRAQNPMTMLSLPLEIKRSEVAMSEFNQQYIFYMFAFAGLWVLAAYNLVLLLSLKESIYKSLILAIIAAQWILYRDSNLFPALEFLNNPGNYFYSAPYLIGMAAAFHYWSRVNQSGNRYLAGLLRGLQWGVLAVLPLSGLLLINNQIVYLFVSIICPVLLFMISYTAVTGHRMTRSTYWAATTMIVSTWCYGITHTGLWLFEYAEYGKYIGHLGTLVAILLLSIQQAERSRMLRENMERIQALSRGKDEFLTTMSHELRTPMSTVIGASHLLKETQLNQKQCNYVDKLHTSSEHMLQLIDNILDLERLDNHFLRLKDGDFNLGSLLQQTRQLLESQAKQKHLELKIDNRFHPLKKNLRGDATRLKQVLLNLLINALKYTKQGQINLKVLPVKVADDMAQIYFEVRDTGIGISSEDRLRIFQPFAQVSQENSRPHNGSGLGLAISSRLVALMGGSLELESTPGQGSCFYFTLDFPLIAGAVTQERSLKTPSKNTKRSSGKQFVGTRVLMVDDDELNHFIGSEFLQTLGVEVHNANNGFQALELLQEHTYDLVFMDISMPEMDGYETTRRIRAEGKWSALPVVALTAHAIAGERGRCLDAGMDDYLSKPLELVKLAQMLEKWFNSRQQALPQQG